MPAANFCASSKFCAGSKFYASRNFCASSKFCAGSNFCASRNICVLFVLLLYVPKSTTLAMVRRSAHIITSFLGKLEEAANQYYVMGARVIDPGPSGRGFEPHRRHCIVPLSKKHFSTANIKALRGSLGALSVNKLCHIPKLQLISGIYENQ